LPIKQEKLMTYRFLTIVLCLAVLGLTSCDALKDAVDEVIESETGCTATDLGTLAEPDLPMCSKAVACCKYIKGECGKSQLLEFPDGVIAVCNAQETVLAEAITQYQGITDGDCPGFLTADACTDGLETTKENYRKTIDEGSNELASNTAPSCTMIVDETVIPLNDSLGNQAQYLPAACEAIAVP
jgi:hypothetical protein